VLKATVRHSGKDPAPHWCRAPQGTKKTTASRRQPTHHPIFTPPRMAVPAGTSTGGKSPRRSPVFHDMPVVEPSISRLGWGEKRDLVRHRAPWPGSWIGALANGGWGRAPRRASRAAGGRGPRGLIGLGIGQRQSQCCGWSRAARRLTNRVITGRRPPQHQNRALMDVGRHHSRRRATLGAGEDLTRDRSAGGIATAGGWAGRSSRLPHPRPSSLHHFYRHDDGPSPVADRGGQRYATGRMRCRGNVSAETFLREARRALAGARSASRARERGSLVAR
jgi:hypothetical protein